jgi:hypothetical protein
LDAGAYYGSRRRLRHSISAVGPEIPSTKKRPLEPTVSAIITPVIFDGTDDHSHGASVVGLQFVERA